MLFGIFSIMHHAFLQVEMESISSTANYGLNYRIIHCFDEKTILKMFSNIQAWIAYLVAHGLSTLEVMGSNPGKEEDFFLKSKFAC